MKEYIPTNNKIEQMHADQINTVNIKSIIFNNFKWFKKNHFVFFIIPRLFNYYFECPLSPPSTVSLKGALVLDFKLIWTVAYWDLQ